MYVHNFYLFHLKCRFRLLSPTELHLQLGLRFTAVFIKVTNMLKILGGHLDYLSKHILEVTDSPEAQKVSITKII
jgi:hypothetical protein